MNRVIVNQTDLPAIKTPTVGESGELTHEEVAAQQIAVDPNGNLISSVPTDLMMSAKGYHLPIFDLDFPHVVMPSQTPGHSHLYVNQYVHGHQVQRLLHAFVQAGLMGQGNVLQYQAHGMMLARRASAVSLDALEADPKPPMADRRPGWGF